MHHPDASKDAPTSRPTSFERQAQRIERVARFGSELGGALHTEFAYYWQFPERRTLIVEAEAFVTQVNHLRRFSAQALRDADNARKAPPVQAAHILRGLDIKRIFEAGKGLEGQARALRPIGRLRGWAAHQIDASASSASRLRASAEAEGFAWEAAPAAAHAPAAPIEGGLTGRLKHWLQQLEASTAAAPPGPPPPIHPGARRLDAFEAALTLVTEVLDDTRNRLKALQLALRSLEATAPLDLEAAGREAALPQALREALPQIRAQLAQMPGARRSAQIAVTQWGEAARNLAGYKRARDQARLAPAEAIGGLLKGFEIATLKSFVVPLTNLHVTFRGAPTLGALFPPPESTRIAPRAPLADTAAPVSSVPTPIPPLLPPPLLVEPVSVEAEGLVPDEAREQMSEPEPAPERPAAAAESAHETSQRRLSVIMRFIDGDKGDLTPAMIYRLIAQERAYHEDRVLDLGMRIRFLPEAREGEPDDLTRERATHLQAMAESRALFAQLREAQAWVAQAPT